MDFLADFTRANDAVNHLRVGLHIAEPVKTRRTGRRLEDRAEERSERDCRIKQGRRVGAYDVERDPVVGR
jgi:hypothetical protein